MSHDTIREIILGLVLAFALFGTVSSQVHGAVDKHRAKRLEAAERVFSGSVTVSDVSTFKKHDQWLRQRRTSPLYRWVAPDGKSIDDYTNMEARAVPTIRAFDRISR